MRSSTWRLEDLRNVILNLGFVGENLHTRQIFDCKKTFDQYPNASVSMTVTPPEGEPYPGTIERDGDLVIWDVRDSDLVAGGDGEIQLVFTQEPHIARSYNARTHICRSQVPTGSIPSGLDDYITRADQLLDQVEDTFPAGGTTGQVLAKKSDTDYDTEWVDQGGGTEDYDELENRPQIGGVTLTGNKTLHDLGAASEADVEAKYTKPETGIPASDLAAGVIPDPEDLIDDEAGAGDTDKVWSADKSHELLTEINSKMDEPETEGTDGQMLTTDGHGGRTWTTPSGTGAVDSSMSTSSTNPVQNKVITHANNVLNDRDVFINKALESGSAVYDLTYTNRAINSTTGEQGTTEKLNRASTPDVYIVPDGCVVKISGYNNSSQSFAIYCFDEGMNLLGGVYSFKSDGTVNLKTNTKFMRFSMVNLNDSNITPAEAKSYATYTCYYVGRVATAEKDIDDLQAAVTPIVVNQNLILGKQWNDGYYNGTPQSSSSYKYVAGIPVESGKTYKVYPRSRMIYIMNAAGTEVNHISADNTTSITAAGDGFAYVTYYTADDLTGAMFYEENAKYEYPEGTYALGEKIMSSVLRGKKWAVLGDSFTAGEDSGTIASGIYKGQKIVYPYLIGNRTGVKVLSFFQSGRTLAYPADGTFHNSVTDPNQEYYYQNIPSDVDYITIYLGINDGNKASASSGNIPLGTATDNTTATYYGAWNVVLSWLRENRPFAHIGIIVSNGCLNEDYRNAMIAMAKKYGVPYIDLNGDERTPAMIRAQNSDIPSAVKTIIQNAQAVNVAGGNTHPNNAAHQFESTFIEQFLCSL